MTWGKAVFFFCLVLRFPSPLTAQDVAGIIDLKILAEWSIKGIGDLKTYLADWNITGITHLKTFMTDCNIVTHLKTFMTDWNITGVTH